MSLQIRTTTPLKTKKTNKPNQQKKTKKQTKTIKVKQHWNIGCPRSSFCKDHQVLHRCTFLVQLISWIFFLNVLYLFLDLKVISVPIAVGFHSDKFSLVHVFFVLLDERNTTYSVPNEWEPLVVTQNLY